MRRHNRLFFLYVVSKWCTMSIYELTETIIRVFRRLKNTNNARTILTLRSKGLALGGSDEVTKRFLFYVYILQIIELIL